MLQHDVHLPDPDHHEHLTRRALLMGAGAGLAGVGLGAATGMSVVAAGASDEAQQKADRSVIDRTDYYFTPVVIVPNDFSVNPAVVGYVRSLIASGNDKLFRSTGSRLRIKPNPLIVYAKDKEAQLAAQPDQLANRLRLAMSDQIDDLVHGRPRHKYVGFYVGNYGNAVHKDVDLVQWLGMAFVTQNGPGNAAVVLADPQHKRGSEDRVWVHESFHLMGYNHVAGYLEKDLMNPFMDDKEADIFIDNGYFFDNTSHMNTPPLVKQPYLAGPADVESAMQRVYRSVDKVQLGSPITGVRIRSDRGGYFQQFERGVIAYLDGYGANLVLDVYPHWNLLEHGLPTGKATLVESQVIQSFEWSAIEMDAASLPSAALGRTLS